MPQPAPTKGQPRHQARPSARPEGDFAVSAADSGVTRGYRKLATAAQAFNFDFTGKTVLDIGSSTGGFTQYALDHSAKKVIAVEKGTHQMAAPLRYNPKVELHEKTDILDLTVKSEASSAHPPKGPRLEHSARSGPSSLELYLPLGIDVILADVSFISLTKILYYAKIHLARSDTRFLVMLKPQFEARPSQLNKGIVKNEKVRRQIIKDFELWLKQNGFFIQQKRDNALAGKNGNLERFYLLSTC